VLDVPKHSDSPCCIQGVYVYVPVPFSKTKFYSTLCTYLEIHPKDMQFRHWGSCVRICFCHHRILIFSRRILFIWFWYNDLTYNNRNVGVCFRLRFFDYLHIATESLPIAPRYWRYSIIGEFAQNFQRYFRIHFIGFRQTTYIQLQRPCKCTGKSKGHTVPCFYRVVKNVGIFLRNFKWKSVYSWWIIIVVSVAIHHFLNQYHIQCGHPIYKGHRSISRRVPIPLLIAWT